LRGDRERLLDIREAIDRILRQASRGRKVFETDELVQTWVVHHLEILGEAARGVSGELRERHPEVPWPEMVAMRHVLAHGYFGVDTERVWVTVSTDLPRLRGQIDSILREVGGL